ncbi:MAG: class I SAM-dependent methyltransferase [bacterium]|nr:class I SAM-dependent methyltransferase [bacterium]
MQPMKSRDIKIDLGAVQTTLLIPLLARVKEAEKDNPLIIDEYARDIVARIDYDFSNISETLTEEHQFVWPVRAYNFDDCLRRFCKNNKNTTVINIGAGLDTTFRRIDDGYIKWVNIDLPDVTDLRSKLIPDSEREKTIGKSVFDSTWKDDIAEWTRDRDVVFMAAGVLFYFENAEVETLFRKIAAEYPKAHIVFDYMPRLWVWLTNWALMRKSGMDQSVRLKWSLERASQLTRWVSTVEIIEEYPAFVKVREKGVQSKKGARDMKIADILRAYNMAFVRF